MAVNFRAICLALILGSGAAAAADDDLVVIGHAGLPKTDRQTLQRLYTGRTIFIGSQSAVPVNLPAGHPLREQFLQSVINQSEDQYTGYWLVRRYVGKGAPPRELGNADEIVRFVGETPGALGYVPSSKVPPGANVVFRR